MEKRITEIIAFSAGDSNSYKTWSNIPYFLLRTLEEKGVIVHRVNIQLEDDNLFVKKILNILNGAIRKLGRIGHPQRTVLCTLDRTKIYRKLVQIKIKKAIDTWSNSQILLCFDYSNIYRSNTSEKIYTMFCDWTIEYEIEEHQKRKAILLERNMIKKQEEAMSKADLIISLFPNVTEKLKLRFGDSKVKYLGNVINSDKCDSSSALDAHLNSNHILFIGRKAYKQGAISLIKAIQKYNQIKNKKIFIDIIGMKPDDVGINDNNISYYGYLNKQVSTQKDIYYNLISKAKCIVNTTENWMGASSIIEAMYWQTPVIINPTSDIIKTFGNNIEFGFYCYRNDPNEILKYIDKIMSLSDDEYILMCKNARKSVSNFTWEAYTERLMTVWSYLLKTRK